MCNIFEAPHWKLDVMLVRGQQLCGQSEIKMAFSGFREGVSGIRTGVWKAGTTRLMVESVES